MSQASCAELTDLKSMTFSSFSFWKTSFAIFENRKICKAMTFFSKTIWAPWSFSNKAGRQIAHCSCEYAKLRYPAANFGIRGSGYLGCYVTRSHESQPIIHLFEQLLKEDEKDKDEESQKDQIRFQTWWRWPAVDPAYLTFDLQIIVLRLKRQLGNHMRSTTDQKAALSNGSLLRLCFDQFQKRRLGRIADLWYHEPSWISMWHLAIPLPSVCFDPDMIFSAHLANLVSLLQSLYKTWSGRVV